MSGQLIIHIGPPKTATTALQRGLQNKKWDSIRYIGINQPRGKLNTSLGAEIYNYLKNPRSEELPDLQAKVQQIRNNHQLVIFSEEQILLHNPNHPIVEKLKSLQRITGSMNTKISVCLRSPEQAIPSFYQQIYHSLPVRLQDNYSDFIKSSYVRCFDYFDLQKSIRDAGFDQIRYFQFDKVIKGQLTWNNILGSNLNLLDENVILERENSSNKNHQGIRVAERDGDIFRFFREIAKEYPVIDNKVIRRIARLLSNPVRVKLELSPIPSEKIDQYYRFLETQGFT